MNRYYSFRIVDRLDDDEEEAYSEPVDANIDYSILVDFVMSRLTENELRLFKAILDVPREVVYSAIRDWEKKQRDTVRLRMNKNTVVVTMQHFADYFDCSVSTISRLKTKVTKIVEDYDE